MTKQRIFSGIQPSGNLHIGNYIGAITQWVEMQYSDECVFCIVDQHAITVKQNPSELRKKIIEITKIYLASGIDPEKSIIFQQSDVSAHAELAWILNCSARMSDLNKMTQFKDKAAKNQNVSVGLFSYPVLMAADILLYDTEIVPVGDDQMQHVELARDIATRFNYDYKTNLFTIPKPKIKNRGARIMGLDNPENKMSKSASSENNYIALTDDITKAKKKIMKAVTDSENFVKFSPETRAGISNLLTIYSILGNTKIKNIEKDFLNKGYGDFKKSLAEIVEEFLGTFQEKINNISDDDVLNVLSDGKKKAKEIADKKLEAVKKIIGFK